MESRSRKLEKKTFPFSGPLGPCIVVLSSVNSSVDSNVKTQENLKTDGVLVELQETFKTTITVDGIEAQRVST